MLKVFPTVQKIGPVVTVLAVLAAPQTPLWVSLDPSTQGLTPDRGGRGWVGDWEPAVAPLAGVHSGRSLSCSAHCYIFWSLGYCLWDKASFAMAPSLLFPAGPGQTQSALTRVLGAGLPQDPKLLCSSPQSQRTHGLHISGS